MYVLAHMHYVTTCARCVTHPLLPLTAQLFPLSVSNSHSEHTMSLSSTISRQTTTTDIVRLGAIAPWAKTKKSGLLWAQTQKWATDPYPFLGPRHPSISWILGPGALPICGIYPYPYYYCIIVIFRISGIYPIRKDKWNIWSNGIVLN